MLSEISISVNCDVLLKLVSEAAFTHDDYFLVLLPSEFKRLPTPKHLDAL